MIKTSFPQVSKVISILQKAAKLAEKIRMRTPKTLTKSDNSFVTIGDYILQIFIGYLLSVEFPDIPLIAEENINSLKLIENSSILSQVNKHIASELPGINIIDAIEKLNRKSLNLTKNYTWVLDPIDGTSGFARGRQYCIALTLFAGNRIMMGAIVCPLLHKDFYPHFGDEGTLILAMRGRGTWCMPLENVDSCKRLYVSSCQEISMSQLVHSFETKHLNINYINQLRLFGNMTSPTILMDSQAKYGVLACGGADIIVKSPPLGNLEYKEKIWDHSAGSIIIEEAGGQITDLLGQPLDFSIGTELSKNHGIVASNGHLHKQLLIAIGSLSNNQIN